MERRSQAEHKPLDRSRIESDHRGFEINGKMSRVTQGVARHRLLFPNHHRTIQPATVGG